MTTVDYFPIQDLPTELEREIFETAARMRPGSALDLVLVARKVRTWIQPLIYEMVTLGTDDTSLFLRTMDELPVAFFQQNVKRLCLTVSVEPEAAARILATCSGLQSLACWVDFRAAHPQVQFSPLIASQHLRRLSMEIRHFRQLCRDPLCYGALFRSLTHLDLIYWEPGELAVWELAALPCLTHLCIIIRDLPVTEAYLLSVISICPSLNVMAVLIDEGADPVPTRDWRIVWLPYPVMVLDWEAPFRGQEDTWSRAEDIVKSRVRELASLPRLGDLTYCLAASRWKLIYFWRFGTQMDLKVLPITWSRHTVAKPELEFTWSLKRSSLHAGRLVPLRARSQENVKAIVFLDPSGISGLAGR